MDSCKRYFDMKSNEIVKKSGEATGYTEGKIVSESTTIVINLRGDRKACFIDQIITTAMANEGDLGSAVLNESNKVIGLLMAGSQRFVAINKIERVQNALDVQVYIKK